MKITDDFINKISETFYDKEIVLYSQSRTTDDEGFVVRSETATETTVLANVIDNQSKIQEDYGIKERFDIAFTCKPTENISTDDIIGYDSQLYRVRDMKVSDSHKLVIGEKWSSKSSISISA